MNVICSNMGGPRDFHTKWSQKEGQMPYITYVWNLKYNTNEHIYKKKKGSQMQRTPLRLPKEGEVGEERLGVCD